MKRGSKTICDLTEQLKQVETSKNKKTLYLYNIINKLKHH